MHTSKFRDSILIDNHYNKLLNGIGVSIKDAIENNLPAWLITFSHNFGFLYGFFVFLTCMRFDLVVLGCDTPGFWIVLFLETWLRRGERKFIILEFIRRQPIGWRKVVFPVWFNLIARPAIRRSMLIGQVLTQWEKEYYASMFNIPIDRFEFIPWPLRSKLDTFPRPHNDDRASILSSGRSACDWETFLRAMQGHNLPVKIVCSRRDLNRVKRLNLGNEVAIYSEIPFEDHQSLLENSAVYVISMFEKTGSGGQVRLANAVRACVPVVATQIKGLEGYVVDGETALLVKQGDWRGLRDAIDRLLKDPSLRERISRQAFERAGNWTKEQYVESLNSLILNWIEKLEQSAVMPQMFA